MTSTRAGSLLAVVVALGCGTADPPLAPPADVAAGLLARDLAWAAASANTDVISAVGAMLASDPMVAVPGRGWVSGRDEFLAALRRDSTNAGGRLTWAPIRGGVSADGRHGFTFGYMTQHRADSSVVPMKYLAYWVREGDDWKLLSWRRRVRARGEVHTEILPPFLPPAALAYDSTAVEAHATSVAAAEQAFSDLAQRVGLAEAFRRSGRADAINIGPADRADFLVGADAIGTMVGGGEENAMASSVWWNADRSFAASSGDLGITFGMIRPNSGEGPSFPFFTVWARETAAEPWRYIAE